MNQKICVITGANSGIGKAATIQISQNGYRVVMACRDRQRGEDALREVQQTSGSEAVELMIVVPLKGRKGNSIEILPVAKIMFLVDSVYGPLSSGVNSTSSRDSILA